MVEEPNKSHIISTRSGENVTILEYPLNLEPKGFVLITAAMGVRQNYYRHLANFLSEQGLKTYSMDYSSLGLSKSRSLRKYKTTIKDWIFEVEDVIDWLYKQKNDDLPLYYVAHSLGGQLFGLIANHNKVKAMISITSQNGYYKYYKDNRLFYILFWYLILPPVTRIFGFFPSNWFDLGEPLPKKIALKWKKWCTSPDYFFSDESVPQLENYIGFYGPILTLSFTDDVWATKEAVASLVSYYVGATVEHRHINPKDHGIDAIGHFGFFRPKCKLIWQDLADWLMAHSDVY